MPRTHCTTSRYAGGFTILELSLSLLVLSIVAGGVSSLLLGMAQHWRDTEDSQSVLMAGTAISGRIARELSTARQIGFVRPMPQTPTVFDPGGGLLIWTTDGGGLYPADGKSQASELALIQQEWVLLPGASAKTPCLVLYRTNQEAGDGADYSDVFGGATDADIGVAFAELCRDTHNVEPIILGVNVVELHVEVDRQGVRPLVRYEFVVERAGIQERRRGAVALVAPSRMPD
jgi:type II secretory pathway pseudopilin PulG